MKYKIILSAVFTVLISNSTWARDDVFNVSPEVAEAVKEYSSLTESAEKGVDKFYQYCFWDLGEEKPKDHIVNDSNLKRDESTPNKVLWNFTELSSNKKYILLFENLGDKTKEYCELYFYTEAVGHVHRKLLERISGDLISYWTDKAPIYITYQSYQKKYKVLTMHVVSDYSKDRGYLVKLTVSFPEYIDNYKEVNFEQYKTVEAYVEDVAESIESKTK